MDVWSYPQAAQDRSTVFTDLEGVGQGLPPRGYAAPGTRHREWDLEVVHSSAWVKASTHQSQLSLCRTGAPLKNPID